MRQTRNVLDYDGTELVIVPLGSTALEATIEKEDYEFLLKLGASPNFAISAKQYVTVGIGGGREYVARLIMKARAEQRIRYKDGNTLNLRKSNLQLNDQSRNFAALLSHFNILGDRA